MSNLVHRLARLERAMADYWKSLQRNCPVAWTQRFMAHDPDHLAIIARVDVCLTQDGLQPSAKRPGDHMGQFAIDLLLVTGTIGDGLDPAPEDRTPRQRQAWAVLEDLLAAVSTYQEQTGDLFPVPLWGLCPCG